MLTMRLQGDFRSIMRRHGRRADDALDRGMQKIGKRGQQLERHYAPEYTGKLKRSIEWWLRRKGNFEKEVKINSDLYYKNRVIDGGKSVTDWANYEQIEQWAMYRDLPPGPIWRSLLRNGVQSAEESDHRVDFEKEAYNVLGREALGMLQDSLRGML